MKVGVVLNFVMLIDVVKYILEDIDFILLMMVNLGFGG